MRIQSIICERCISRLYETRATKELSLLLAGFSCWWATLQKQMINHVTPCARAREEWMLSLFFSSRQKRVLVRDIEENQVLDAAML